MQEFGYMWGNFEEQSDILARAALTTFDGPATIMTGWFDVLWRQFMNGPVAKISFINLTGKAV